MRVVDQGLQCFTLGRIPETIVNKFGIARDQAIAQVRKLAVHGNALDIAVRLQQDGAAWGLIHATALHANKAVFYNVDTSDAVLTRNRIEVLHHCSRIHCHAVDCHTVATLEVELDILRFVRRIFGISGQLIHRLVVRRCGVKPRIFENARFVRNV